MAGVCRTKPAMAKAIKGGERVVNERFGVDASVCSGDHACIRVSGCPSLSIKPNPDPMRQDPVATVLDSDGICVRAGHHCAMPLHDCLNIPATARASFYLYNTFAEVDALIDALYKAKKKFSV